MIINIYIMSNIIDFNNKNKYDFVIIKQRYKILNAFNEIVNFIKNNKIPLFSLSAMEIIFNKFINIKNPIIVITNQKNEFFLDFFKYIYKNFKLFYTINKNKGIYTYYLELQPVLIIYFSNKINNFKLYNKDNFTFVNPFLGLADIYYKYSLPFDFIDLYPNFIEIEEKFLNNLIENHTKKSFLRLYMSEKNEILEDEDDNNIVTTPTFIKNIFFSLFQFIESNIIITGDCMLTGSFAYNKIMNIDIIPDDKIEIIAVSADKTMNDIKIFLDSNFNDDNFIITKNNNSLDNSSKFFNYFFKEFTIFYNRTPILTIYEYYSQCCFNIFNDSLYIANYHNIIFHMLISNFDNIIKFITLFHKIAKDNIDILDKGNFQVFQYNHLNDAIIYRLKLISNFFK